MSTSKTLGPMPPRQWAWLRGVLGICLALVALPSLASERRYLFDTIDSDDGLLQNTVLEVMQGRDGRLWIATQGGLHHFDGYRFDIYENDAKDPASLPDSVITALAEDEQGRIWIGTRSRGVVRLDPASGRTVTFDASPEIAERDQRIAVATLAYEPGRGLWIGSSAGLELLDPASSQRQTIVPAAADGDLGAVQDLLLAGNGELWVASANGLWRLARGQQQPIPVAPDTLADVRSLVETRGQILYVGNREGLFRIDRTQATATRLWSDTHGEVVRSMAEDFSGQLWLALAGQGLVRYMPGAGSSEWIRPNAEIPGSLPGVELTVVFVDRSGLLWVGNGTRGVSRVDPDGALFRFIVDHDLSRDQSASNNVRAILEDQDGSLWIGTDGDGLKRYERSSGRFSHYDAAIAQAFGEKWPMLVQIEALARDGDGAVWFASNLGIGKLEPGTGKVTSLKLAQPEPLQARQRTRRALIIAADHGVWFSGRDTGVVRYDPVSGQVRSWVHKEGDDDSLSSNHVLTLYEDRGGRIWAGTIDGLNVIDPAQAKVRSFHYRKDDPGSLSNGVVRAIHESADGGIWIGTHGGLNHLAKPGAEPAQFERWLKSDGLPDSTVYAILEDAAGRLWVSTNRGIAVLDPVTRSVRRYSQRDGLQGQEFNGGAFEQLRGGEFAFGGINGVNIVRPDTATDSPYLAPAVFSRIRVADRDMAAPAAGSEIVMDQDDRIIRFEFAALDFTAPQANQFRYRLEGFDKDWVEAGTRHDATYTNLDPGRYRFRLRASNHDGVWNENDAVIDLRVRPGFWNSNLAYALYALCALVLAGLFWASLRRKRAERLAHAQTLEERESRLRLALWGSNDEFWDLNMETGTLVLTGAARTADRQRRETHSVYDWAREHVHPDDQRIVAERLDEHLTDKVAQFESEQRVRLANGIWIWVLARGKIVERTPDGRPLRICGTARNITARREAERERRISQEVIASMREGVSVCDLEFNFVKVNPAFARITGWAEHELIGRSAAILNCNQHSAAYYQNLRTALRRDGLWRGELWQRRANGEEFLSWIQAAEIRDPHGQRTHFICVMTDITERKRNEQELRYLANYDTLTGLPNRTLLSDRLGHAVVRARRGGRKVAVLFLDLDRFKHVNDSMGHAAGDRLLKAAGARLRENVRDADTVARIGGDEFTVILEELVDAAEAERVAEKLIAAFERPLDLADGQDVVISPSIGISLYPDHGQTPTELLKFADTAMYQAKDRGRKTYMLYTEAMDASARMRATLVGALRKAIERNELRLVYQPKMSLIDHHMTGVEALLRWRSSELGDISPVTFIPVAEDSGLIVEIGDWVLVHACAQLAEWQRNGLRDVTMSVNLSVLQLQRPELIQRLCDILAEHDIAPSQLELELTESVVMANAEQSISTLRQLKAVGMTLSIDDFGTGYSSLSYLRRLPIDTLKIDKEFVGDITTDPDDEAITATVITMAHSLGLNVIAEGVETAEQAEYLREQGCDEIQGHWLSKPLPPEQCFAFLRARRSGRSEALDGLH